MSIAYAYAVVAQAGMNIAHYMRDYGVDLIVSPVHTLPSGQRIPTGYSLHFQLKSTVNSDLEDDHVVYDLKADAYNRLANWTGPSCCYLLLLRLPADKESWLSISEDVLALRHCCYWHFIEPGDTIQNTSSKRIRISRNNKFTADALMELMDSQTKKGQP